MLLTFDRSMLALEKLTDEWLNGHSVTLNHLHSGTHLISRMIKLRSRSYVHFFVSNSPHSLFHYIAVRKYGNFINQTS